MSNSACRNLSAPYPNEDVTEINCERVLQRKRHVGDELQFNVAATRAKECRFVIGNLKMLDSQIIAEQERVEFVLELLQHFDSKDRIRISPALPNWRRLLAQSSTIKSGRRMKSRKIWRAIRLWKVLAVPSARCTSATVMLDQHFRARDDGIVYALEQTHVAVGCRTRTCYSRYHCDHDWRVTESNIIEEAGNWTISWSREARPEHQDC